MALTDAQVRLLSGKLNEKFIRTREDSGVTLSYIEGWHTIDEANRVFGFDAWDRETVWAECVWADGRRDPKACSYAVRVRIRVRAGDVVVCRDGSGVGHGTGVTLGMAHESALKEAETDATKRALTTFGNLFGLALYDKAQNGVRRNPKPAGASLAWSVVSVTGDLFGRYDTPQRFCAGVRAAIEAAPTAEDLDILWMRNAGGIDQLRKVCPDLLSANRVHYADVLERIYRERLASLKSPSDEAGREQSIDKSKLPFAFPKRIRDEAHRRYVASLPCLICARLPSQAHHLRFAQPRSLGSKVSDEWTVPLCSTHHRALHDVGNEELWWVEQRIDAKREAERLWHHSHGASTPANTVADEPMRRTGNES